MADIGGWLLLGVVLAGALAFWVPDDFFSRYADSEPLSLLVMLAVGIPLYVCATASTPIAAALVLKGLSPGAALVFLLAGPATNVATLMVLLKTLGRRACAVYLLSIGACSLVCGWLVNRLYDFTALTPQGWLSADRAAANSDWPTAAALLLLVLIAAARWPKGNGRPTPTQTKRMSP